MLAVVILSGDELMNFKFNLKYNPEARFKFRILGPMVLVIITQ